jgi:hypothetical protein
MNVILDFIRYRICRRKPNQYIYQINNLFGEVQIPSGTTKTIKDLDTDKMSVWICDRNFKLIHATNDNHNDLTENQYLGKYIYDVTPKDFGDYLYKYHKSAQEGIETKVNLVLNGFLVYLKIKPLRFINDEIFASAVFIVPYK